jgi:hypothetical protein
MKIKIFIITLIGLLGFIIFLGSVGEISPEAPFSILGIILGTLLISIAFLLASQKKVRDYTDQNFNNEA